jgi:hypothetical protein
MNDPRFVLALTERFSDTQVAGFTEGSSFLASRLKVVGMKPRERTTPSRRLVTVMLLANLTNL